MDPGGERESEQRACELGVQTVTEPREVSRRPEACITRGPCVGNVPGKLLRRCHHSPRRSRQAWGRPRSGEPAALVFTGVCALKHVEGRSEHRPNSSISPRFLNLHRVTQGWVMYCYHFVNGSWPLMVGGKRLTVESCKLLFRELPASRRFCRRVDQCA